MAQPYVGEIRMFAGTFAPAGWMFCDGQILSIAENDALFTLIGTTYGGDGQNTFALPNLQSRIPLHFGTSTSGITYNIAEMAGVESATLTLNQIPAHTHPLLGSSDPASSRNPGGQVLGRAAADSYASEFTAETLHPGSVSPTGGSQPHTNMQPYLCINYIISLFGIYPSQT